jgi:predicted dienelactone hydrolase
MVPSIKINRLVCHRMALKITLPLFCCHTRLAWLGQRTAQQGFISVAVNYHGNTSVEPYRAEGFLSLWERARDLTVLPNLISSDDFFRDYINMKQGFVGGFSTGAYTALLLLSAIVQFSKYEPSIPIQNASLGLREFPDLAIQLPGLIENSAIFHGSWEGMSSDYRDRRFKAALLYAPGRSILGFSETSLG